MSAERSDRRRASAYTRTGLPIFFSPSAISSKRSICERSRSIWGVPPGVQLGYATTSRVLVARRSD
jgi:hypothetical protein